jgi:DNA-binding transcriptional regulator LsrR (DeoR family)
MFALKEAEDRLRKTEYAKENLARDLERQTNKVQMIEKNQELMQDQIGDRLGLLQREI